MIVDLNTNVHVLIWREYHGRWRVRRNGQSSWTGVAEQTQHDSSPRTQRSTKRVHVPEEFERPSTSRILFSRFNKTHRVTKFVLWMFFLKLERLIYFFWSISGILRNDSVSARRPSSVHDSSGRTSQGSLPFYHQRRPQSSSVSSSAGGSNHSPPMNFRESEDDNLSELWTWN